MTKFGAVIRSTGEETLDIVKEALRSDPNVGEFVVVENQYPLYKAAAATHKIFSEWVDTYKYVFSIDADVVPFPGFGKWIEKTIQANPHPEYSRWLPPLLDWVVQGRWRTAGGIFCYKSAETVQLYEKYLKTADQVEPEHNYEIFSEFQGKEWRPPLEQFGEIVSVHQFAQAWEVYFYRGLIHTLRVKDWIRPNVLLLADKGFPEYKIFLEGVKSGLTHRHLLSEDASFRDTEIFKNLYEEAIKKLGLSEKDRSPKPANYSEAIKAILPHLPEKMYPIKND